MTRRRRLPHHSEFDSIESRQRFIVRLQADDLEVRRRRWLFRNMIFWLGFSLATAGVWYWAQ